MSDESEPRGKGWERFLDAALVVGVVIILGVFAAIAIPTFAHSRNTSQQNACLGNLRIIDSGKEQGAMAYKLTDGDTIASALVHQYMKGNTGPICSSGGTYVYGKLGERPVCTVVMPTSHVLP